MAVVTGTYWCKLSQALSDVVSPQGTKIIRLTDNNFRVGDYFYLMNSKGQYELGQMLEGPTQIAPNDYQYTFTRLGPNRLSLPGGTPVYLLSPEEYQKAVQSGVDTTPSTSGFSLEGAIQWAKNNPLYAAALGVGVYLAFFSRRRRLF